MTERPPFTVISNDAPEAKPEEPSPIQAAFNVALASAVKHVIDTRPITAVIAWEAMTEDGPELRFMSIPGSEAVLHGMLRIMHDALSLP